MGDDGAPSPLLPPSFPSLVWSNGGILIILPEGLVHFVGRSDLHINDGLPPMVFRVSSEPNQVRLQFRANPSFILSAFLTTGARSRWQSRLERF